MQPKLLTASIMAAGLTLGATAQAADVRINGFISVVGGTTLSEGTTINKGVESKSVFTANGPTNGVYDDDISFKPDTMFGLQVASNLGKGLSVTGQITGAGGEDFDANVAWAYLTYEFNDTWALMAGRQRIPFYINSDYLDVGYAYHWVRPPTVTDSVVDDFEGLQFRRTGYMGDWDTRLQLFAGENSSTSPNVGDLGLESILGAAYFMSTDQLQLRATYLIADLYLDNLSSENIPNLPVLGPIWAAAGISQGDDNPIGISFGGLAARWNFGSSFVMAEYVKSELDDGIIGSGFTGTTGYYVSLGHQMGEFTPHITYSARETSYETTIGGLPNGNFVASPVENSSITVGLRWDFHPSAAFKVEYLTRSDDSSADRIAAKGNASEVDLFSAGIDVIF